MLFFIIRRLNSVTSIVGFMNDLGSLTFSPAELAAVIGVSQSSVKRWVDAGHIPVSRTAGGHRRISRSAALQFIRTKKMRVVRPDLLGIPDLRDVKQPIEAGRISGEFLHGLMAAGKTEQVRQSLTAAYLGGMSLAELFDGPIRDGLERVGEVWRTDQRGIFIEHGATCIVIDVISQLAGLTESPSADAPLAVGAAPKDDPHLIPTQMAGVVLQEAGWRTINMGADTPVHAIYDAVEAHQPEVVWLALKTRQPMPQFREIVAMSERLAAEGVTMIVGGVEAERTRQHWPESVRVVPTMVELASIAHRLRVEKAA